MLREPQKWCTLPEIIVSISFIHIGSCYSHVSYVDDERPSPARSAETALEIGGERALEGTGQHSTNRLSSIVDAHTES